MNVSAKLSNHFTWNGWTYSVRIARQISPPEKCPIFFSSQSSLALSLCAFICHEVISVVWTVNEQPHSHRRPTTYNADDLNMMGDAVMLALFGRCVHSRDTLDCCCCWWWRWCCSVLLQYGPKAVSIISRNQFIIFRREKDFCHPFHIFHWNCKYHCIKWLKANGLSAVLTPKHWLNSPNEVNGVIAYLFSNQFNSILWPHNSEDIVGC